MSKTYYAVCNVGGPISVELKGSTEAEALAAFAALDGRAAIDAARTDAEDALDIDGSDMSESEFAGALVDAGAQRVRDLSAVINAHAGTSAHEAGGWYLWSVDCDDYGYAIINADGVICSLHDERVPDGQGWGESRELVRLIREHNEGDTIEWNAQGVEI